LAAWLDARHGEQAPCEVSGQLITKDQCEIDHQAPDTFKAILDAFLQVKGLGLDQVSIQDLPNGRTTVLSDKALTQAWLLYHRERARLRVLSRETHVAITRGVEVFV